MLLFVNLQVAIKEHGFIFKTGTDVLAQVMEKGPDDLYTCYEYDKLYRVEIDGHVYIYISTYESSWPCGMEPVVIGKKPDSSSGPTLDVQLPLTPHKEVGGDGRTPNAEGTTPTPRGSGGGNSSTPSQTSSSSRKHDDDYDDRNQMVEMMDEDEIINTPYRDEPRMDLDFDDLHIPDIDWITGGSVGEQGKAKAPCPDDPKGFDPETQPGAFEGVVMSELSYDNEKTRKDCKGKLKDDYGWEVADEEAKKMGIKLHDSDTGLDCTLLKKPDGSGFVLAFAGTDPGQTNVTKANILATLLGGSPLNLLQQIANGFSSFSLIPDVKTDLYQWFYGMDPQYFKAMKTATELTAKLKEKYGENVKITFVGHSLGGGLASLASIVTGYPALTYNAAALSPWSKLELAMKGYNIDSSNIHRYSMETDPLTGVQFACSILTDIFDLFDYSKYLDYNALGEEHEVKYDDDVSWGDKTNVNPLNWLNNHSCVTIIDNLDCDEVEWSNKE